MPFKQGVVFRGSLLYIAPAVEGPDDQYVAKEVFPLITAQGNNVGWEALYTLNGRNRSLTNDTRLAGMVFVTTGGAFRFKIELPSAGDYLIRLAAGDPTTDIGTNVELFDSTTSLGVLCSGAPGAANSFRDATDVVHTAANWPANNNSAAHTFTTTNCIFELGGGAGAFDAIAYFSVEAVDNGAVDLLPDATSIDLSLAASVIDLTRPEKSIDISL